MIVRSLLLIATAVLLCAFIWGGKNYFMNGSTGPIFIEYESTTGPPHSGNMIRFGGLKDSTDNGDLLSVRVRYISGRVTRIDSAQVQQLRSSVHDAHGVWWIGDSQIEYLSGRDANAAKLLAMRWNSAQQRWEMDGSAPHRDFIKMTVGYALTCRMAIAAVADTIMEARYQARKNRRGHIASEDLRSALLSYRIPSDVALQQAFQPGQKRRMLGIQTVGDSLAPAVQRRCMCVA